MPAKDSFLSASDFGYGFVVATTERSINATILNFLATLQQPPATICFVLDDADRCVPMDLETFKLRSRGTNPFELGTALAPNSPDFRNLMDARFFMGFSARPGVPPISAMTKTPYAFQLDTKGGAHAVLSLLCSELLAVVLEGDRGRVPELRRVNQMIDQPWIFTCRADLRLSPVSRSQYDSLPPDVRTRIANLSGQRFRVQQLHLDLANAMHLPAPEIPGLDRDTRPYEVIQQYFVEAYCAQLQKHGSPLLGCAVVAEDLSSSRLAMTDMDFQVSLCQSSASLSTLDYLCSTDGARMPPPARFQWDWIDSATTKDHDGVISINRNILAGYLQDQFRAYVETVCVQPDVRVWQTQEGVFYQYNFARSQSPTVTNSSSDPATVLEYSWTSARAYDEAGIGGAFGALELKSVFNMTVQFRGTQIIVEQNLLVWLYAKTMYRSHSANVYDTTITDVFDIGIDGNGKLEARPAQPKVVDNTKKLETDPFRDFWDSRDDLMETLSRFTANFVSQSQLHLPLASPQDCIFPGGNTFKCSEVKFSDHQDLTALITYTDPAKVYPTVAVSASSW